MSTTTTPTYAKMPDDATVVEGPLDICRHSHIDGDSVEALIECLQIRATNRSIQRYDGLVTIDTWATKDPYNVADSRVLLVGAVEDYSDDAYLLRGAFEVDMSRIEDYEWLSDVIDQIDETDEEHVDAYGRAYMPKKAVDAMLEPRL